jgi:CheY-like chemotaxis protein
MFEIDSAPGKGTTARLIIPLAENARSLKKSTLSSKTSAGNIGQMQNGMKRDGLVSKSKSIRVLLADDHAMMREGLRSVLEAHKDVIVVGEAADGEEAIAMVLQLQPAVVIMDINMPKVNGIDATAYIKSRHPTAKVIGLSVNSGPENQAAMLQAGADMLLTKEMAVEELYRAIQRVLPHAESRGANESKW